MNQNTTEKAAWEPIFENAYEVWFAVCPVCDDLACVVSEWLGEDEAGQGWYNETVWCPHGHGSKQYRRPE